MSDRSTNITEVGTVIVPVTDQDRALEFYVGTLGFEVRIDGEFAPGERWLEADHAALTEAGVDVGDDLIRMGEGVPSMFAFADPDGNTVRVVERP
jgi:catechol 2,3-dioxygenase-like lactoylglutathione lyase family enzyme